MRTEYTRPSGLGLTYDIEVDGFGNFTIRLGDKVLKTGHDPLVTMRIGKAWKYPTAKREREALAAAKFAIDGLRGMDEE